MVPVLCTLSIGASYLTKLRENTLNGWLVGCLGFNGPLRQYFSLYRAVSQREGELGEKRIDESKNVQTAPTRTYYKRSRPLPYCNPNCRTPRHRNFTTQHHRTTPNLERYQRYGADMIFIFENYKGAFQKKCRRSYGLVLYTSSDDAS